MQCERIRTQLTAYLEGDLDGDAGTVVRGHLRGCEACRKIASDEAVLRDGMRALPPVDPPASLWANVQARLAAEEVAESNRPGWKRMLSRWRLMIIPAPKFAIAGVLVAAAAGGAVYWKTRPVEEPAEVVKHDLIDNGKTQIVPDAPKPKRTHEACVDVPEADDVTADLANDIGRSVTAYDCAIEELLTETTTIRAGWDDTQRSAFDERVKTMREAIAKAAEGKPRKHASRALVSYIQRATVREEVLLAGGPR